MEFILLKQGEYFSLGTGTEGNNKINYSSLV